MKLRALRLHGFKSFADRTEIVFHDGITAIVGPNGCGKSNISDAIRWVLGEQRPTAIRGAKMEEVIFQGTVNRRPVSRGSVSMEVSNEDRALAVAFQEVEFARTIYRDGGSDYSLNRSACRLKDIHELFRDTGLGTNAYAVIENRMIDVILSDRAEERRGLFEEAAGIGKYKDRRRAASRRLERAEIDLQRLEDLIVEVQSKVRSLARQKGKAERFRELRGRRLDVEMTLARAQLGELDASLRRVQAVFSGDVANEEGLHGRVAAQESRLESLRVEQLSAESARGQAALGAEAIRTDLIRWERELAVAGERSEHAGRRLERIGSEREEARGRMGQAEARLAAVTEETERRRAELAQARHELERYGAHTLEIRGALSRTREAVVEVESREREVVRRLAQLYADAEAAEARGEELAGRIGQLEQELSEAREALSEAESQGDLFADRTATLASEIEGARVRVGGALEAVSEARLGLQRAREREMASQDRHGRLAAEWGALDQMERDRQGMDPAVRAVLSRGEDGVLGILADFLSADPDMAATVEASLGVLLKAVVVRDSTVASRVATWFREGWEGGGGLILLPLDRAPQSDGRGTVLARVSPKGPGVPWVRALLDGVELADRADLLPASRSTGDRVSRDGAWVDRRGAFWLGNPEGSFGILDRRERLRVLAEEVRHAEAELAGAREERERLSTSVDGLDADAERARAGLREVEDAHRAARAEVTARSEQRSRIEQMIVEIGGQLSYARAAREQSAQRVAEGEGARASLLGEEESLRERRGEAREALDRVQERLEEARAREAVLTVERTRLEGEDARLLERAGELERSRAEAGAKIEELDRERVQLEDEAARVALLREEGREETEKLFGRLAEAERALGASEEVLGALRERVQEAEKEVKESRAMEREASEKRHLLELEAQELAGRHERLRDRLEAEWGRPFAQLLEEAGAVEGSEDELREELREVGEALSRLGPVNLLALEEHEEESARLAFLTEQRDDLVRARNDLREAIREINQTATRLFSEAFEAIRARFKETFVHLFEGGECDLWLADPDDPLESDVEIHAAPRGKRTQRIDLLSGGERALTALSLLFGIYLVKPSPFCVMDEVDAPLDEANIGRFIRLLEDFKGNTQFVVITHNPRTIEAADWIYGVTMEEPGVSTIVGVRLDEALEVAGA
ncbi:MAG: chromosome segregation protein SMC [Gemmatimonadetes bacterium]|nr:chromosome segregation protein SMC [Gemmatimonadota bacterium]